MEQNSIEKRREVLVREREDLLKEKSKLKAELVVEEALAGAGREDIIISRGNMSAEDFVEESLTRQDLSYETLTAEMQKNALAGTRPALDNISGRPIFATEDKIQSGEVTPL